MRLEELLEHADYLLGVAAGKCDSWEDAQDLVQATLLEGLLAVRKEKKIAKKIMAEHTHFAFVSDAHNTSSRKPNWDLLQKKVKSPDIAVSDSMFEKYSI